MQNLRQINYFITKLLPNCKIFTKPAFFERWRPLRFIRKLEMKFCSNSFVYPILKSFFLHAAYINKKKLKIINSPDMVNICPQTKFNSILPTVWAVEHSMYDRRLYLYLAYVRKVRLNHNNQSNVSIVFTTLCVASCSYF